MNQELEEKPKKPPDLIPQQQQQLNQLLDEYQDVIANGKNSPGWINLTTQDNLNELFDQQLQQHIDFITDDFQQIRLQAQQKQKQYYDKGIKPEKFNIGDKVLLYELAKASIHGYKFRKK